MADLKTTLCGIEIDSPFVLASGPAGFNADGLIAATKAGAGAVVTKSISYKGVVNTTQHMISPAVNTLINNEGGSDMPLEFWMEEIPKAKKNGVKCLIASVGGALKIDECVDIANKCVEAGADIIEIVVDYHDAGDVVERIRAIKNAVKAPILVKVNANWKNTTEIAALCSEAGADGITAIDSMGPALRIDIETGKPIIGGKGYGYLTGAPIFPFALKIVHDIASSTKSRIPIVGTGGVTNARNAMEMLMAGASCVGVCTVPILHGPQSFKKLCDDLSDLMDQYGYKTISELTGKSLRENLLPTKTSSDFKFDNNKCTHCGKCVIACPYRARTLTETQNIVNEKVCRVCGLCESVCPKKAITL